MILAYTIYLVANYDGNKTKSGFETHFRFLLLISTMIGGLSYRLGIDTLRFEDMYNTFNVYAQYNYEDFLLSCNEPIWYFLQMIIKKTGADFWVFRLAVLGFVNTTIFWFVKKYSPAVFFSILVYFIYSYFAFNFQVTREAMAVAFSLIGLDCFLSNKRQGLLWFLFWVTIAVFCHHFAFIAIVLPFATRIRNGKWFIVVFIVSFLLSAFLQTFFSELGMLDENLAERMEDYLKDEKQGYKSGISIIMLVKNLIMSVLPIYLCVLYSRTPKIKDDFYGITLAYVMVGVLTLTSLGIMYRLRNYLAVPMAISMGGFYFSCIKGSIEKFKLFKINIIKLALLVWLFFAPLYTLFSSRLWPMYIPYSSVLFEKEDETREALYHAMGEY